MRAALIFLFALFVCGAAAAQTPPPAEDGLGPYHFGMTIDQLRDTSPSASWTLERPDGRITVLSGGPRVAIAGSRFRVSLIAAVGHGLQRILLEGAAAAACDPVVRATVENLEPLYGAFSGAPLPWELDPTSMRVTWTNGGSEIRTFRDPRTHEYSAYSTRSGPMFVEVQGHSASNAAACNVTITLVTQAEVGRAPGDAATWATIDTARTLENRIFTAQPSVQDYDNAYPAAARMVGYASGEATLDCLVVESGALRCVSVGENPPGFDFGRFFIGLSPLFRVDVSDPEAIGKRVHFRIVYLVRDPHG